jgi:hypothetical protein
MASRETELPSRAPIGRQLVGHEQGRRLAALLQQLAHDPQSGHFVLAWLDEHIQDFALAVDGSP